MSDPRTPPDSYPSPHSESRSAANRLVSASLGQPWLILLMTVLLLGAGIRSLGRLSVDAYPDLSPPQAEFITQWPGHAAEEVERLISVPLERGLTGIPRMTVLRSKSLYGLSDVIMIFEVGTDNYFARQLALNNLAGVSLPSGVTPSLSPLTSPSGLIYRYVLASSDRSPMELKTFEDWTIAPAYRSVPGVADNSGEGGLLGIALAPTFSTTTTGP